MFNLKVCGALAFRSIRRHDKGKWQKKKKNTDCWKTAWYSRMEEEPNPTRAASGLSELELVTASL